LSGRAIGKRDGDDLANRRPIFEQVPQVSLRKDMRFAATRAG
jgi:hypothetical protein